MKLKRITVIMDFLKDGAKLQKKKKWFCHHKFTRTVWTVCNILVRYERLVCSGCYIHVIDDLLRPGKVLVFWTFWSRKVILREPFLVKSNSNINRWLIYFCFKFFFKLNFSIYFNRHKIFGHLQNSMLAIKQLQNEF